MLFSPAPSQGGDDLCRGRVESPGSRRETGSIHLLAAFCVSGNAQTEIVGEVEAAGPDDPRFKELIGQVIVRLFRPDLPDTGDGGGPGR